ncbi:protein cysQ [Phenylobacterium zucineum HLK1]|uniref:3'(2'),5'-bisphosphate nucleotidase CysQ n=1 Tax=Phenylobacterium zucineum (strain HLK1) TaxID=450851 RepID=B4RDA4_PHEZH|nr:protein cysQ [Phenylobacterium zucineum HLK1]
MRLTDTDVGERLAQICEAAAELILPLWRSGLAVDRKSDESPVTEADRRGEALILQQLAEAFPGLPVVSEEDASEFGTPDAIGPVFFLVDPLDGTKAFVRGDAHFTVNIGLVEDGRPVAGAVCCPPTGETWFTSGGRTLKRVKGGASAPVRVRAWPEGEALALTSLTARPEQIEALRERYGFSRTEGMDSSIKLCRIAEGAADVYPRHGPTMEWDIAAGHAVLAAAGGQVTTPEGEPFVYGKADQGFRNGWFVARGG